MHGCVLLFPEGYHADGHIDILKIVFCLYSLIPFIVLRFISVINSEKGNLEVIAS